jgi:hypothetical protein
LVWCFEDARHTRKRLKSTDYFKAVCSRPDRQRITDDWILRVVEAPEHEHVQEDGRIRRWARIQEAEERYLRVVLLPDRETVHNAFFDNAFFDRGFEL